jgi:hypothetical protein
VKKGVNKKMVDEKGRDKNQICK